MYGIKDIRFAIRMAPTPEQLEQIKHYFDNELSTRGIPLSPNRVLSGYQEETLLTVDEALEMFQTLKAVEAGDGVRLPDQGILAS
jgi:hypothetical protein